MIQSLDLCSALAQVISEHRDHLAVPQNLYLPVTATWAGDDSQDRASGNGDRRTVDVGILNAKVGFLSLNRFPVSIKSFPGWSSGSCISK